MISSIKGTVIFSDGEEVIIQTSNGVGYEIYYKKIIAEGSQIFLFLSNIFRETDQTLYGFQSLQEKKAFEQLISVKGVGPKIGFSILTSLGVNEIYRAIESKDEKVFKRISGVGAKSADQIILDLQGKAHKMKMYHANSETVEEELEHSLAENSNDSGIDKSRILEETLLACKELGFAAEKVLPLAQDLLKSDQIQRAEQLIHLVLKEI